MEDSPKNWPGKFIAGVAIWLFCQLFVSIWWASNVTTRLEQIESGMLQTNEISERLIRVETQLTSLNDVMCQLRVEVKELRRSRGYNGD